MQIALRHLQECFYMQSSEMMLAYKILTNIQTKVELKTTGYLWIFVSGGECTLVVRESRQGPKN